MKLWTDIRTHGASGDSNIAPSPYIDRTRYGLTGVKHLFVDFKLIRIQQESQILISSSLVPFSLLA